MTVPPPVIAANRAQLMALIATNFFGQNTPAIAATEAHYSEMWVQDATAMYGYAAILDREHADAIQRAAADHQPGGARGPGRHGRPSCRAGRGGSNPPRQ